MDKFQAMLILKAVVDHGSFTAAARKLDISASAATKNVTGLEESLGVQLFNRSTRRVTLTDYGRQYYESAAAILSSVEEAETSIRDRSSSSKGLVRVVMPYSFGRVTFTPELPAFIAKNPEISLDVQFSDEGVNIIKEGFDLAVRSREMEDSQLFQRVLHRGPLITVASPAYLERHSTPETPVDLESHHCIVGNYGSEWHYKNLDGHDFYVRVGSNIALHNGDAVREAAVAGVGIAQSTWWLFRKDLKDGKLVRILRPYEREAVPISVCYVAKKHIPRKVATVLEFLSEITSEKANP